MNTKKYEPTFQLVANSISKIDMQNTIVNISDEENLEKEFSVEILNLLIEEHEEYKTAGLDIEVKVSIFQSKEEESKKFEIIIVLNGVFVDSTKTSNEKLKEKLRINGSAALYSIARGCITNISSQALAQGKVVLPLVNFVGAFKNE